MENQSKYDRMYSQQRSSPRKPHGHSSSRDYRRSPSPERRRERRRSRSPNFHRNDRRSNDQYPSKWNNNRNRNYDIEHKRPYDRRTSPRRDRSPRSRTRRSQSRERYQRRDRSNSQSRERYQRRDRSNSQSQERYPRRDRSNSHHHERYQRRDRSNSQNRNSRFANNRSHIPNKQSCPDRASRNSVEESRIFAQHQTLPATSISSSHYLPKVTQASTAPEDKRQENTNLQRNNVSPHQHVDRIDSKIFYEKGSHTSSVRIKSPEQAKSKSRDSDSSTHQHTTIDRSVTHVSPIARSGIHSRTSGYTNLHSHKPHPGQSSSPTSIQLLDPKAEGLREARKKAHTAYLQAKTEANRADIKFIAAKEDLTIAEFWLDIVTRNLEDVGQRMEQHEWRYQKAQTDEEMMEVKA